MSEADDGPGRTLSVQVSDPRDAGARADVVLGRRVAGLSRRVARQRGLAGALSINERRAAPSDRVVLGDRIALRLSSPGTQAPPAVTVLALTDAYVYVDKPPGIHTQRLRPDDPPTLADAVAALHPECAGAGADAREGGAVHRLDHGTSGVVCFARHRPAWDAARAALRAAAVRKTYIARVAAPLPEQTPLLRAGSVRRIHHPGPSLTGIVGGHSAAHGMCVDAPLGPQSGAAGRRRVQLAYQGRDALTDVWAIEAAAPAPNDDAALRAAPPGCVVLNLHTGHRHQARVHLAALGCAIVGDPLYAAPAPNSVEVAAPCPGPARMGITPPGHGSGLLLHAAALDLSAVIAGQPRVVAALPARFWPRA